MPIKFTDTLSTNNQPTFFSKFPAEGKLPIYLVNFEQGSEMTPLGLVNTFYQNEDGSVNKGERGLFFGFVPDSTIVPPDYASLKNKVSIFAVNKTLIGKILNQLILSLNGDELTEPFNLTLEPDTPVSKTVHLMLLDIKKNNSGKGFVPEFTESKPSPKSNSQYIEAFKQSLITYPVPYASIQEAEWGYNAMTNGYLNKRGLTQYLQPVKPAEQSNKQFDPMDASEEDLY